MKIAINLLQYTDIQGIEIYASNVLSSLFKNDKDNTFILYMNQKSAKIFDFHGDNIIRREIKFKNISKIKLLAYQQLMLPLSLIKERVDLLYCPSIAMPLFYSKKIVTILDCAFFRFKEEAGIISRLYIKSALWSSKYNSKKIITISDFSKREIMEVLKVKEDKVVVAYAALPKLAEVPGDRVNSILEKFDLNDGPKVRKYFLYVGNFRPRKNVPRMIDAFNSLGDKYEDIHFLLVGKIEERFFNLEEEINKKNPHGRIKYLGVINEEEKAVLYQNTLALVFYSLYEGFGLPVLEAQSLGVPVLTSNSSSLIEVAADSALLTNPLSVEEMSLNMKKIIEDGNLRDDLIKAGKINLQRFSWDEESKIILEIFNNLNENTPSK